MDLPQINCYQQLFVEDVPLMDVRAPVEYQQGSFPKAVNLPLIDNNERHAIGIRYKEQGQVKAIELGHNLVKGEIKQQRLESWSTFTRQNPQGALYCFRGGMRSKICQQWLYENTGVIYPRVQGGYKALRRYLLENLESLSQQINPVILSGRTGTGKTYLLHRIEHKIDLEDIYRHRGSAFGNHVYPQPTQIDIENKLSIVLLKYHINCIHQIVLEDESSSIGSRRLPDMLVSTMRRAPIIVLESDIADRINIVFKEYIISNLAEFQLALGTEPGFDAWAESLRKSLNKIQNRLGGVYYGKIQSLMDFAISRHKSHNEPDHHKSWIHDLLVEYYDPMYDYQLSKKSDRITFRGDKESILYHINHFYCIPYTMNPHSRNSEHI